MTTKLLKGAALAAILVTAAAASAAAEPNDRVSVMGADVEAVHSRIVAEARDLCGSEYVASVHSLRDLRTCERQTVDDAIARAQRPDLAAFHAGLDRTQRYELQAQARLSALAQAD